ncbi:hypothetical protein OC845_003885 [Tilletia horrida]|nr:hypothetical protein OC845_003885 [Tilletia horrida]
MLKSLRRRNGRAEPNSQDAASAAHNKSAYDNAVPGGSSHADLELDPMSTIPSTARSHGHGQRVVTASSGFAPGSEAELLLRAAAARSPRSGAVEAMAGPVPESATPPAMQHAGLRDSHEERDSHSTTSPAIPVGVAAGRTSTGSKSSRPPGEASLPPMDVHSTSDNSGPSRARRDDISHSANTSQDISSSATSSAERAMPVGSNTRVQQLRVFIVNRQRYGSVLVRLDARAREVTLAVLEQESVNIGGSDGGWAVWDVCPGMGIERPLREYEVISQAMNVRASVTDDYFLLKRTELAPHLALRAVPPISPALAGYVYVEDRKKKWTKRWLELRDHCLYHAKSEKGKDEVLICSLSTFDVYLVDTAKIKTPKPHAFAIRSQNNITMFEKPDQDYVHYFCLSDPAAHRSWVRAILNARTYVLKQEQAALFKVPAIVTAPSANAPSPLMPSAALPSLTNAPHSATNGGHVTSNETVATAVAAMSIGDTSGGPGLTRQSSLSRSGSRRRAPGPADLAARPSASAGAPVVKGTPPTMMVPMMESNPQARIQANGMPQPDPGLSRSSSRRRAPGPADLAARQPISAATPSAQSVPPTLMAQMMETNPQARVQANGVLQSDSGLSRSGSHRRAPGPADLMAQMMDTKAQARVPHANGMPQSGSLARARTTTGATSHTPQRQHANVPMPTASVPRKQATMGAPGLPTGPFAKGSLLENMAKTGAGKNGLGVDVATSQPYLQAQALAAAGFRHAPHFAQQNVHQHYPQGHHAAPHQSHRVAQHQQQLLQQQQQQQQQQPLHYQQQGGAAPLLDFSIHEKTRLRMLEEARKQEMMARMRKAREEGRPLVQEAGYKR